MAQRTPVATMFLNWWIALQTGWTSNTPMNLLCQPSNAMAVVSIIPLLACSCAPLDMTGMTKSIQIFSLLDLDKICSCSWIDRVRTKLREAHSDYDYSIDICIRGFYRNFNGSSGNPEKGFLQSLLLVKTFKHIFTSPSSSHDISIVNDEENNVENIPPSKKTRRTETGKAKANTRKAVAANLHLTSVTPRAIAYAAVQVWKVFEMVHISQFLSLLLHSLMHLPGALNTTAWTSTICITLLSTISRMFRIKQRRINVSSFLHGGIGKLLVVIDRAIDNYVV